MTSGQVTPVRVGTLYKVLGVLALVALLVVDVLSVAKGHGFGIFDVAINLILLLVILALIRPAFFNDAMKSIAAKLPGG